MDRDGAVRVQGTRRERRIESVGRPDRRQRRKLLRGHGLRRQRPMRVVRDSDGMRHGIRVSPPEKKGGAWTENVLYNFQGGKDGDLPSGPLVFDSAGNLYGATEFGGGKGATCNAFYGGNCGTVFKLSPPKQKGGKWTEKVLHSFAGVAQGKQYGDGAEPNGGLVLDSKGALYGTTAIGGNQICRNEHSQPIGCGTVFRLHPPGKAGGAWIEWIQHRFRGYPNDGDCHQRD